MYFVPTPMLGINPRGLAHAREVLSHQAAPSSPSLEHIASVLSLRLFQESPGTKNVTFTAHGILLTEKGRRWGNRD